MTLLPLKILYDQVKEIDRSIDRRKFGMVSEVEYMFGMKDKRVHSLCYDNVVTFAFYDNDSLKEVFSCDEVARF